MKVDTWAESDTMRKGVFTNIIYLNVGICIGKKASIYNSVTVTTNIFQLHRGPFSIFKITCP